MVAVLAGQNPDVLAVLILQLADDALDLLLGRIASWRLPLGDGQLLHDSLGGQPNGHVSNALLKLQKLLQHSKQVAGSCGINLRRRYKASPSPLNKKRTGSFPERFSDTKAFESRRVKSQRVSGRRHQTYYDR
jgi:hypothetical protein